VVDNKIHTISKTHLLYAKLIDAIKSSDWDKVKDLVEPKQVVINYGKGNVSIQGDKIFWKGQEMHNALTTRMVQMIQEEFPVEPLVNFMENLMKNPSRRAVNELYGFLEKNSLPITPEGRFLAFKAVKEDYLDVHSNSVLNKPAEFMTQDELASFPKTSGAKNEVTVDVVDGFTTVEMERNQVDDDQNRTCSAGLHFCSRDYLNHFGGQRIVILEICPSQVVSIPSDYGDSKGRCAEYRVIGEIDKEKSDLAFNKSVQTAPTEESSTDESFSDGEARFFYKGQYIKQEYDSYGKALSMTENAIRKRRTKK